MAAQVANSDVDGTQLTALVNTYDLIQWSIPYVLESPFNIYSSIVYGDGMWVTSGRTYKSENQQFFAYSYTGYTWTLSEPVIAMDNPATTISYGGNDWVAGSGQSLLHSTDGKGWEVVNSMFTTCNSIIYVTSKGKFIAGGGGTNSLAYSDDGTSWIGLPNNLNVCHTIATNGVTIIAGGQGNTLVQSTDGLVWDTVGTITQLESIHAFIWFQDKYIATGVTVEEDVVVSSPDGINWTSVTSTFLDSGSKLYVNGDIIVISGDKGGWPRTLYSHDGINWVDMNIPTEGVFGVKTLKTI